VGQSAHVVRSGNVVFIAGQTAEDRDGGVVGVGDPTAQARQAYSTVATCVWAVGGAPDAIVHMTVYISDRDELPAMRGVRQEFLGDHTTTTRLLVVAGLSHPEFLIEVGAIACLEGRRLVILSPSWEGRRISRDVGTLGGERPFASA
jgi:enamine deaminase RidA (YjgF/YER057c/UK114 family)